MAKNLKTGKLGKHLTFQTQFSLLNSIGYMREPRVEEKSPPRSYLLESEEHTTARLIIFAYGSILSTGPTVDKDGVIGQNL